jgi:hypothetical protein
MYMVCCTHHPYHNVTPLLLQQQQHDHTPCNRPKRAAVRQKQPALVSTLQHNTQHGGTATNNNSMHVSTQHGSVVSGHL